MGPWAEHERLGGGRPNRNGPRPGSRPVSHLAGVPPGSRFRPGSQAGSHPARVPLGPVPTWPGAHPGPKNMNIYINKNICIYEYMRMYIIYAFSHIYIYIYIYIAYSLLPTAYSQWPR